MTSELVSIAIGGYEDCHLVNAGKNIHSDDAQEAYNKWNNSMLGCEDGHTAFMAGWCISRKAMQDAFEQVFVAATALADDFSEYYDDSEEQNGERLHTVYEMRKILSLTAPFRKTGV